MRKVDRSEVVVVCGPPGAGKTSYVMARKTWGDIVVDLDFLYQAITGLPLYERPANLLPYVLELKATLISKVFRSRDQAAWIITSAPTRRERDDYRRQGARIVVLETFVPQCVHALQGRPAAQRDHMVEVIKSWWDKYEPSPDDERVVR